MPVRYALINPNWTFKGSVYFGCREPHLPIEYGYAKALLERAGHEVILIDGQMDDLSTGEIAQRINGFRPDFTVVTTAPSYLFWRCPPPELRAPQEVIYQLRDDGGIIIVVGPHGSVTPGAVLNKLWADIVVMGECEEVLPKLAGLTRASRQEWRNVPSICYADSGRLQVQGMPYASDMAALPMVRWPQEIIRRHRHQHHRFDAKVGRPGAELEASRGCPFFCTFCAKSAFRNTYRKRPLAAVIDELDDLIGKGSEYVYFIDEIFLPDTPLLEALAARGIKFGIQTRIDLWEPPLIGLLGRAGCVSIEAGIESISEEGRRLLNKNTRLTTGELVKRLLQAREHVPFVQATLLDSQVDSPEVIEEWRRYLHRFGVWTNKPVPMFPYPGSQAYERRWGLPDDRAWERAHDYYLKSYSIFSDIQDDQPLPLQLLELGV